MFNRKTEWESELINKNMVPISPFKMREMGIKRDNIIYANNIEDLRKHPPGIIIATAQRNVSFVQNWFKKQMLIKKRSYVMGLGVYQQLHKSKLNHKINLKPGKIKFKNVYRPYMGQDVDGKTLLVFRTGGIGDLLFIQPNLNYLKSQYDCYIKFACGPQYQAMVETWDCVDELLDLPFDATHLYRSDYHMLFEGVIERCKEAETTNAYNLFSRWLGLDLPDKLLIPKQEAKSEHIEACEGVLDKWNLKENSFILAQIRSSTPIRTPRTDIWLKIIDKLTDEGVDIVLTDSPRMTDKIEEFIKRTKNPDKVFNFCKYSESLDFSIAMTSLSRMTMSTDSAFVHIAASLDIPCFGIYGPFPGYIRLKTYPKADWVDAKRDCAPCFIHSQEPCPKAGVDGCSPCYDNLDIEEVVGKVMRLFNG